jgi:hypothetical protein
MKKKKVLDVEVQEESPEKTAVTLLAGLRAIT